jgi:hypothetical protein
LTSTPDPRIFQATQTAIAATQTAQAEELSLTQIAQQVHATQTAFLLTSTARAATETAAAATPTPDVQSTRKLPLSQRRHHRRPRWMLHQRSSPPHQAHRPLI